MKLKLKKSRRICATVSGLLVLVMMVVCLPGKVAGVSTNHTAPIEVLIPSGATLIKPLNMGTLNCSQLSCELTLSPLGVCTPSAGAVGACDQDEPAEFTVLGATNSNYIATFQGMLSASLEGGGNVLSIRDVTSFTQNLGNTSSAGATTNNGQTGSDGTDSIFFGGSVDFLSFDASGVYKAVFEVTISFA